jgi:hypothetical protein
LLGILEDMGKEVYMAVQDQLGAIACRILVPSYSEVYPVEDLIWDNTNKALLFRTDILNLHRLDDTSLEALLERLNNNELDDYLDIGTLMCRAFFDVFFRYRFISLGPLSQHGAKPPAPGFPDTARETDSSDLRFSANRIARYSSIPDAGSRSPDGSSRQHKRQ